MSNYLDHIDIIDYEGHEVPVLLMDRETAALANLNKLDITQLYKNIVYVPGSSIGLDNTGATDCSSILESITDSVGLKAGTYLIDSDCTINAQIVLAEGAVFNISSGVTLTINGQILAGRYQIFSGDGDVVVDEGKQEFGYPEWFNDDIIKCYKTFRHIKLAYKVYTISENLELNRPNTCIEGISYPTIWTENCSMLNFVNGARLIIGVYDTTVINEFPRNITIKNLFISGGTSLDCISVFGVVRCIIEGVYIWTQTAFSGISFYRAIGSIVRDVFVQSVGISGTFMGYRFADEGGHGLPGERSASVWLENCTYADTNPNNGNTIGFHIGKGSSDVFLSNCEVAEANIGISFDSLSDSFSVDFLINNCDFDSCRTHAIMIYNCSKGLISFNNCYGALKNNSVGNETISVVNSPLGVVFEGMQVILTKTATTALMTTSNACCLIHGLSITDNDGISGTTAIDLNGATNVSGDYIYNGSIASI